MNFWILLIAYLFNGAFTFNRMSFYGSRVFKRIFIHAFHQKNLEMCPAGEVPFLSANSGDFIQCNTPMDCPKGYYCSQSTGVCCGIAGTCANPNETPLRDELGIIFWFFLLLLIVLGRLTPCSPTNFDSCPEGTFCRDSILSGSGQFTGQHLCCQKNVLSCPISGVPVPSSNEPQQCSLENPYNCPIGSTCQPR